MASGPGELFELWIEELYTYKKKRLETALLLIKLITTCDRSGLSPGTAVSSTNKTDRHDIAEILLKVALNTINHMRYGD
jgi:pilus assembly protein TadC